MATIPVERVDKLEEAALPARRLGGSMQRRRTRVLAGDREVAEDDRCLACAQLDPGGGTVRTAEVGVDDQLRTLTAAVVLRAGGWYRGAG